MKRRNLLRAETGATSVPAMKDCRALLIGGRDYRSR
jgi:hypothetical protein